MRDGRQATPPSKGIWARGGDGKNAVFDQRLMVTPAKCARTHAEIVSTSTLDADGDGAFGEQGATTAAGGAGFRAGGACDAGAVAGLPGAERGDASTLSVPLGIGASQRSSRSDETIKTDSPGEQGEVHGQMHRTGVYSSALRRVVKGVGGALSVTRAVADATVEREGAAFILPGCGVVR